MQEQIRIGIVGYGNIGRGVELAIGHNPDMRLDAIFTRRNPADLKPKTPGVKVLHMDEAQKYVDQLDVVILCGGSATDLPEQGPEFAAMFNIIDSFDTHARIPEYFAAVDAVAKKSGKVAIISTGWDPGLFSILRVYNEAAIPNGHNYTFWGPGLSQGHSDAIRRVPGVKDARQYTIPIEAAVNRVRANENPELTTREKHFRDCYVVAEEGADLEKIRQAIVSMPNYFEPYETRVNFISQEELNAKHTSMAHGGFVLRSGESSEGTHHLIEYSLKLDSNPEFTSSVMVAYARAAYRMQKAGQSGSKTVFDVAPAQLSMKSAEELRRDLL